MLNSVYHEGDHEETENFEKAKGWLKEQAHDIIMVGAGVRTNPENYFFFEKLINQVHKLQPQASICFNTRAAEDAAEAVQALVLVAIRIISCNSFCKHNRVFQNHFNCK